MINHAPPGDGAFAELPLLVWLSPAFPVGGFAYSHGLEAAVDDGVVRDGDTLAAWVADLLAAGSGRQDAILLAAGWRAGQAGDAAALRDVNALALALCPGRERLLETSTMGASFAAALAAAWPGLLFPADEEGVAYAVAVGAAAGSAALSLRATLEAFALAFVANLVSSALRLGIIGQTDGQRVTAGALPAIRRLAGMAAVADLDAVGACAFRSDIGSLRHETQYSRLFRS